MSMRPSELRDLSGDRHVPIDALHEFILKLLKKKSVFQFDAQTAAERWIEADLFGLSTYGVRTLPAQVAAIDQGEIDPRGRVLVEKEAAAVAVLDGSRALGPVAATKGMQTAIAKARASGAGIAVVHHSQPFGAAAIYAVLAAAEGLIGFCTSAVGGAVVSAPDAVQGAAPNAPFAWAIPTADAGPLIVDFTAGTVCSEEVSWLAELGLPLPDGAALDAEGRPTTDPRAARRVTPLAGAAGFGWGLLAALLGTGLAGGKLPHQKSRSPAADGAEHLFLAIDIAQFTDLERYRARASELRAAARQLSALESEQTTPVPGDRFWQIAENRRQHGIPVAAADRANLSRLAAKLKLEPPWPADA